MLARFLATEWSAGPAICIRTRSTGSSLELRWFAADYEANLAPMIINVPNFSRRTIWWGRATALSTDADTSNALRREASLSACRSAGWTDASKTKRPHLQMEPNTTWRLKMVIFSKPDFLFNFFKRWCRFEPTRLSNHQRLRQTLKIRG
jgi:hypothetical protein